MDGRLILEKDLSGAYALSMDEALARASGEPGASTAPSLHLYSIVEGGLLGRYQGFDGGDNWSRRPTGGPEMLCGEGVVCFGLAGVAGDGAADLMRRVAEPLAKRLKMSINASGALKKQRRRVGFVAACRFQDGATLVQGALSLDALECRSVAVAQRHLREAFEQVMETHFAIDTPDERERALLGRFMRRYTDPAWLDRAPSRIGWVRSGGAVIGMEVNVSNRKVAALSTWGTLVADAGAWHRTLTGLTVRAAKNAFAKMTEASLPYKLGSTPLRKAMEEALKRRIRGA